MSRPRLDDLRDALALIERLRVLLERLDFETQGLSELNAIESTLIRERTRYQNRSDASTA
jgi:hypothetical protein